MRTSIACTPKRYRIIPPTADIIAAVHDDDENRNRQKLMYMRFNVVIYIYCT